jgi:hypothetical protein
MCESTFIGPTQSEDLLPIDKAERWLRTLGSRVNVICSEYPETSLLIPELLLLRLRQKGIYIRDVELLRSLVNKAYYQGYSRYYIVVNKQAIQVEAITDQKKIKVESLKANDIQEALLDLTDEEFELVFGRINDNGKRPFIVGLRNFLIKN